MLSGCFFAMPPGDGTGARRLGVSRGWAVILIKVLGRERGSARGRGKPFFKTVSLSPSHKNKKSQRDALRATFVPGEVGVAGDADKAGGGQQIAHGGALPPAVFEEEDAAGHEGVAGGAADGAQVGETVFRGKEGVMGFVEQNFGHDLGAFIGGDVRGIADEEAETARGERRGEHVAEQTEGAGGDVMALGVASDDAESGRADVHEQRLPAGALAEEGNADAAGAGAEIGKTGRGALIMGCLQSAHVVEGQFDEQLCFRAGNEGGGADREIPSVEFASAEDMGQRFAVAAASHKGIEARDLIRGGRGVAGEEQARAIEAGGGLGEGAGADMGAVVMGSAQACDGLTHEGIERVGVGCWHGQSGRWLGGET